LFFFSSRRRHTRSLRDWSSDVCSSDLSREAITKLEEAMHLAPYEVSILYSLSRAYAQSGDEVRSREIFEQSERIRTKSARVEERSEERRVGKECRWGWWR